MLPVNYNLTFRFCFISLLVLFVLYFLNDLDVDSQYFSNIYAAEIANNNNNNYDGGKERINFDYIFDSSEYFEEDNVPQNNNNNNNINNYNNRNSQLISQQQSEEEKQQSYNEIKKEKTSTSNSNNKNKGQNYEFTSIESKENNNNKNYDIKSNDNDYVIFNTRINLQNIEKEGFLRVIGYISGQSFKEDILLSSIESTAKKLDIKLKVLKDTELISLSPPDEFQVCVYHIKDLKKEYYSILHFDCNEGDVQSSSGTNTINLFKPSSMKYNHSQGLYERQQIGGEINNNKTINNDNKDNDNDKVLLKIISPLSDKKNTKELKIAAMVRGQIKTELIKDVQAELKKSKDNTITKTFTFDRKTDLGNIQIGDLFLACVTSEDLNPPEGQECEKRLVKKVNSANSLPAR